MDPVSGIIIDEFLKENWAEFSAHCKKFKTLTGRGVSEIYSEFERYLPMSMDINNHLEESEE